MMCTCNHFIYRLILFHIVALLSVLAQVLTQLMPLILWARVRRNAHGLTLRLHCMFCLFAFPQLLLFCPDVTNECWLEIELLIIKTLIPKIGFKSMYVSKICFVNTVLH